MASDAPFFPPPPLKGEVYRAPAPRPLEVEAEKVAAPSAGRTVVTRPEPLPADEPPPAANAVNAKRVPDPALAAVLGSTADAFREERAYWGRYRWFAKYPRALGAALSALGVWMTWSSIDVLLHGGYYFRKQAVLGPVALVAGLWPLVCGYPLEYGHPPGWWKIGYAACAIVGAAGGLTLLFMLSSAR